MGFSIRKLGRAFASGINPFDDKGWTSGPSNTERAQQSIRNAQNNLRNTTPKYGPLRNQQVRQKFMSQQAPRSSSWNNISTASRTAPKNTFKAFQYGTPRSLAGTAEGFSGLYDLATPGKGTNRFTKLATQGGKNLDEAAKRAGVDSSAYRMAQFTTDAAGFLAPGAVTKVISTVAKTGGTVGKGAKFLSSAEPVINKVGLKYLSKPTTLINAAVSTGRSSGYRTARDKDVSPVTAAQDFGTALAFGKVLDSAGNRIADPLKKKVVKIRGDSELGKLKAEQKSLAAEAQTLRKTKASPAVEKRLRDVRKEQKYVDARVQQMKQGGYVKNPFYKEPTPTSKLDDESTAFLERQNVKEYFDNKPVVKGSALTGEGAKLPPKPGTTVASVDPATGKIVVKPKLTKMDQSGSIGDGKPSPVLEAISNMRGNKGYDKSKLSLPQKLSPDRIIRENITNPLERGLQRGLQTAETSTNPILRGVGRFAHGISKESGVTDELLSAKRKLHGGIETGKLLREDIADAGKAFDKATKERVWASLDPEQAAKKGVSLKTKLTPEETVYREGLKKQIDEVTQGNLDRGLITPEQAANGSYIKRGYSIFEESSDASKAYNQTRASLLKQFTGRKDVSADLIDSAITDPSYLVAKKTAESNAAWSMVDYGKHLSTTGMTSDVPRPGYVQLPSSKVFGDAAGKYVPKAISEDFTGFQYNNGILSAFNDLITAYDDLGIRRGKKQLLTIFNPAVRVGNQFSNRVVFSNLNGINPIQFQKNMLTAKAQIKARGPLYREAVSQGLTGLDITQADFAKRIASATDDPNMAVKAMEYAKKSYSQADDQARLAAYITHRNRGYPVDEAARLTQRGFQDYNSVGFFYDMAAKTPLIGNAFVRFAGDAMRIAKNGAMDHPLRAAGTIALWATFVNQMSKWSGESAEDKKTREDRFGAPKLPFSNISTAVQTPWGEVNVSRFLPFYQLNDVQGSLSKLLPISKSPISYKDGKLGIDPAGFNDPLLGQVVQFAADKDFRGKSIKDPENSGQFVEDLPANEQRKNQAGWLAAGNLPLGRELNSLYSAVKGGEDIYGKKRSLPQAAARAMGIKVEQYGPEQAKEQRSTNTYFNEKEKIDAQIKGLSAKDQEAYKRVTGYYKLRETTDNAFKPGEQRNVKAPVYEFPEDKWKEYTTSPKLYDLAIKKKEEDFKRQKTPIQPEFDKRLSTEFRKQLINNKSLAPGEDVEADERMYSNSEWDTYQKIKAEYTAKASKYYPKSNGEFVDELVKHKQAQFPAKPAAKAAYDAAYSRYAKGQGPKPEFNDSVAAAKDQYNESKRVWTNTERKARGLPPISKEVWDNVTFGFQSDEEKVYNQLKYGKGYGSYARGGGGGSGYAGYYGKTKSSVKGKVATPSIKGKAPVKLKGSVKYASAGKPKVTIKKSLV